MAEVGTGAGGSASTLAQQPQASRPNILHIMSDQQLSLCPSAEIPAAIEYVDGRATPQKPLVSCLVNVRYLRNVVCVIFAPSPLRGC
jgi:hypothetical protein